MGLNKYGMRLIPVLLIAILGLASLAWGIWTLAAPARQVGQYPRYGHAADFSWIAGEMLYHVPVDAKLPEMGCSIFRYEEQGTQVKLEGPGWRAISDLRETRPQPGTFLVLFGQPARAGEQFICAKDVPGYFVERVQVNPNPYPQFGHADDLSWIAGQITELGDLAGTCWGCECAIIHYGEKDARVQMDGPGWSTYWLNNHATSPTGLLGQHLVLFGHLAQPGEAAQHCQRDRAAPVYIVDQVQENPAP